MVLVGIDVGGTYMRRFPGVWFTTGVEVARWHEKQGQAAR